ncbi:MAG: hypothetical protein JSW26_31130 [Desulfobacterales bacterium]|nr:MAG: hypothetical protein JSW26_31130 [Desulfobacterales bacterium]
MPLAFDSLSHGTIAFGFFNIESDMLLCDRYFLFATEFCAGMVDVAENAGGQSYQTSWQIQFIQKDTDIGDLSGAIHGVCFTGFIGELYRHFPFPKKPEDFKQNPEGYKTQARISQVIAKYGEPLEIPVAIMPDGAEIQIGDYRFNRMQFQQLLLYVWRGGFPRWRDETRPAYVIRMRDKLLRNCRGIFKGIVFEG